MTKTKLQDYAALITEAESVAADGSWPSFVSRAYPTITKLVEAVRDLNRDVERCVRNARPHEPGRHPRWVAVMDTFAHGSTFSHQLCLRYGLDPDEQIDGPEYPAEAEDDDGPVCPDNCDCGAE